MNDLVERHKLKKGAATTEAKLAIMVGIEGKKEEWGKVTEAGKQFVKRYLRPTMYCLKNHCNGSVEVFATKYPEYQHTKFKAFCNGKGDCCSI